MAVSTATLSAKGRLHCLDRLKVMLTALVVVHHAAITYGAMGDWFYREPGTGHGLTAQVLTLFCAVNQSFFMGMFFLLSGYVTPDSFERRGAVGFLKERLIRLGIPLLVFGLALGPLTLQLASGTHWSEWRWTFSTETGVRFVMGPLWFCWALLIFSIVFVGVSRTRLSVDWRRAPSFPALVLSAILVGLTAFVLRLMAPVGHHVMGLQVGYFVSYVVLFAVGCMAARFRVVEALRAADVRSLVWVSLATLPMLPVLLLIFQRAGISAAGFAGGWNLAALAYALWEPLVAWGVIGGLLLWGHMRLNHPSRAWAFWTNNAYGAFLVHAPVLVGLSVASASLVWHPFVKWLWVSILATVLSFGITFILRLIPTVKRVL